MRAFNYDSRLLLRVLEPVGRPGASIWQASSSGFDVDLECVAPVTLDAINRPPTLYQVPGRASEVDRTPRTYATTQYGQDSFLARPPPVRDTSSDARSWSRQTEDALDAYKHLDEKHGTYLDQTVGIALDSKAVQDKDHAKLHDPKEKIRVEVAEYRLDPGNSEVKFVEPKQQSEKSPSSYYATYLEAAELENDAEEHQAAAQKPPKNHRMTKMIVKEDIDFFTAVLEGHSPPATTQETQTFVRDETETRRHIQEVREQDADKRRQEEAAAAKADTDFFMMLMQQE